MFRLQELRLELKLALMPSSVTYWSTLESLVLEWKTLRVLNNRWIILLRISLLLCAAESLLLYLRCFYICEHARDMFALYDIIITSLVGS